MTTQHEHDREPANVAERPTPEMMIAPEVIAYLRLDADERDAVWRLRNLIRAHGLPVIKRGRLQLFRKSAIDAWLEAKPRISRKRRRPARLQTFPQQQQPLTSKAI
jgi:hypothetical protein